MNPVNPESIGRILVLLLLLIPVCTHVSGQSNAISINGSVQDQTGAVIARVQVVLRDSTGRQVQTMSTDGTGGFRFEKVTVGKYEIQAEHTGFKRSSTSITVGARSLAPLRIVLAVADVQEEVTVGGTLSQTSTDPDNNLDVVSVNQQTLNNLPVLDQNYVGALSRFLDSGSIGTGGVTLIVDGMEATKAGVSASAIQEVRINNNPYSAELSRQGRGRIEIITRPDATDYHGTMNFVFRDQHLNARDPFALIRPPEQRRIYEGNLTGPLGRSKKTSFLFTANREEEDLQAIVFALSPTETIRQNVSNPVRNTEWSARITRQLSNKSTLSILYSYQNRTNENQGVGGFNLPEVGTNSQFREDIVRINHRSIISPKLVNQTALLLGRFYAPTRSVRDDQRIVVQEAFTGGGAQADFLRTEYHWTLNQMLSYSSGKHLVKAGVQVPDFSRRGIKDQTNYKGTFFFSTLEDFIEKRPFSFVQQQGVPRVIFWEIVLGAFVQDEIRLRSNLSAAIGLRYDWQNYFYDHNNFAPRISFAYAPGNSNTTVLRWGAGLFYDRTGPQPIADILRYDGVRQRRFVLINPGFPDPVSGDQSLSAQPTSVVRLDPNVRIPYTAQYSFGVERQLAKGTALTINYIGSRGIKLFRSRDINAPLPPLFAERLDPRFAVIRNIESEARLASHALEVGLRGRVTRFFDGLIQYTLGRSYNNTAGVNWFPASNHDLSGEWGRADFDERHRFNLLGTMRSGQWLNLGLSLSLVSGRPYNLITGRDDNRDSAAQDRPPGVARNTLQGPGLAQLDLRWSRSFHLNKAKKEKGPVMTPAIDVFNVTNHVNFAGFIGNLSSPFFGKAVAARPSRRLQLSLRFAF